PLDNGSVDLSFIEAVARVGLRDPSFRRSLPLGFAQPDADRTAAVKEFRDLAARLVEQLDGEAALNHFADELVSMRESLLRGQLEQIRRLHTVTADARAGVRPNLMYRLTEKGEHLVVSCAVGEIQLPAHAAAPVRHALTHEDFAIGDLPGDLDEAGKLVLVKRLVREGLVRLL
ncbi:MAG: hypothetical protein WCJ30_28040, partial [Deltaproteobacteria bacterium]